MPDRVVDLAAQHATPALLTVRDWLLVALAFATGIYEGISFLTFGKVFSAAQTGNIVLLGIGARTHEPAGPNEVTVAVALAAWFAGAALAMPILKTFQGDREIEDRNVFQVWPRRVSIVLVIGLILQAGFLAVWVTAAAPATAVPQAVLQSGWMHRRPKVELLWDSPAAAGHNRQTVFRAALVTEGDRVAARALDKSLRQA